MTSGGNGSRLASRSSSAFSLSLCRLDGLVFSLAEDGFLMMRRTEGREIDKGLNGHRDVCVDGLVTIRSHAFSCKIRIALAKWPQINHVFFCLTTHILDHSENYFNKQQATAAHGKEWTCFTPLVGAMLLLTAKLVEISSTLHDTGLFIKRTRSACRPLMVLVNSKLWLTSCI